MLPDSDGIVNWEPPTYDPQTGLFYVATDERYSVYYRTEPNVKALQGLNGIQEQRVATIGKYITAIDYKTGKIAWRHLQPSAGEGGNSTGLTTTAGKLLFGGDATVTLLLMIQRMESRFGIRTSALYRMQWKRTCSTASNTFL